MKPFFTLMLILACSLAGCAPQQPGRHTAKGSFEQLLMEFKDRAARKSSDQLTIIVTEEFTTADQSAATIQVRKQSSDGVPGNAKRTAEIIEAYLTYDKDRWRCSKAESTEFEGDKVVSQNSLDGPDIRLPNLFIWCGL